MWENVRNLDIDKEVAGRLRVGILHTSPVAVAPSGPRLEAAMDETAERLRASYTGAAPGAIPGLAPARDLYRAFGIDPTRHRPSSEALTRRILKGEPLPRINNAVDVCNLCAVRFFLSIGLYDAARVEPPVVLRRGLEGEAYAGIRKDEVRLEGRPVLADRAGPFGNPTSDSLRSAVTPATRSIVMVIFSPGGYTAERLRGHMAEARNLIAAHLAPVGATAAIEDALYPPD